MDDKTFKTFAFNSHVPAYIDGGMKDVPMADLLRISAEPNLQEWMDLETWAQAVQVAKIVLPHKVAGTFSDAVDGVRSWF